MKKILILGAGMVAKPLVRYLLDQPEFELTVADLVYSKAEKLVAGHPRGTATKLDLKNLAGLSDEIAKANIAVSLVPYDYHPDVARCCIRFKIPMVTTSYISEDMKKLDDEARSAGILILNEIGLDPGLDHMEAMRIIQKAKAGGGSIASFQSYCGGLPAPDSNTNPFGYKFSWSPVGVLLAGKNRAEYLMDGDHVIIEPGCLFENYKIIQIEGLGDFEGYPNRNSIPYAEIYGIETTKTILRGTLRYRGWCATLQKMVEIGLLDQEERDWSGLTYSRFMGHLVQAPAGSDIKQAVAEFLGLGLESDVLCRLEWLGLFEESALPFSKGSAMDMLAALMQDKLSYKKGEKDMIVLQHRFEIEYPDGTGEKIISTLLDYGIPDGDSSMSRMVGLPAAIGTRMILEGRIRESGVHIPVKPEIYTPILMELRSMGITFLEKKERHS